MQFLPQLQQCQRPNPVLPWLLWEQPQLVQGIDLATNKAVSILYKSIKQLTNIYIIYWLCFTNYDLLTNYLLFY